jgi:hypothetical protein
MNGSLAFHRPAMLLLLLLVFKVRPTLAQDATAEWKTAIVACKR